jgi:hypothetical protein
MLVSLALLVVEVSISIRALDVQLSDLEGGPEGQPKRPTRQ